MLSIEQQKHLVARHNRLLHAVGKWIKYKNSYLVDHVSGDKSNMQYWEREVTKIMKEELAELKSQQQQIF